MNLAGMLDANPFARSRDGGDPTPNPAFDNSLRNVIHRISRSESLIPVVGEPGTGKTLLLAELERRMRSRGTVRRLLRGDLLGDTTNLPNLLLVDEGDRADFGIIEDVFAGGWTGTMVLASAHDCAARLPVARRSRPERLRPLRAAEARALARARLARAGQSDLVAPNALDELAKASKGNLRSLVQIGGAAVFFARDEGSDVVRAEHVRAAAEMRGSVELPPSGSTRRSGVRSWPIVPRMRPLEYGRQTMVLAAAGVVFALALTVLGWIGTTEPATRATSEPLVNGALPARPQLATNTFIGAQPPLLTTAAPRVTHGHSPDASAHSEIKTAIAAEAAEIDPSIRTRLTTVRHGAIAVRSARRSQGRKPDPSELADAGTAPVSGRIGHSPNSPRLEVDASALKAPAIAVNLAQASTTDSIVPQVDAHNPGKTDNGNRKAAINARDAMREMRLARGG